MPFSPLSGDLFDMIIFPKNTPARITLHKDFPILRLQLIANFTLPAVVIHFTLLYQNYFLICCFSSLGQRRNRHV